MTVDEALEQIERNRAFFDIEKITKALMACPESASFAEYLERCGIKNGSRAMMVALKMFEKHKENRKK